MGKAPTFILHVFPEGYFLWKSHWEPFSLDCFTMESDPFHVLMELWSSSSVTRSGSYEVPKDKWPSTLRCGGVSWVPTMWAAPCRVLTFLELTVRQPRQTFDEHSLDSNENSCSGLGVPPLESTKVPSMCKALGSTPSSIKMKQTCSYKFVFVFGRDSLNHTPPWSPANSRLLFIY